MQLERNHSVLVQEDGLVIEVRQLVRDGVARQDLQHKMENIII
jgi:hypothetical protein